MTFTAVPDHPNTMSKAGKRQGNSTLLRRRVLKTYADAPSSVEQLVDRLRDRFSEEYGRCQVKPFNKMVKQILIDSNILKARQKSRRKYDDEEDGRSALLRSKKAKKSELQPDSDLMNSLLRNSYIIDNETKMVDLMKEDGRGKAQKPNDEGVDANRKDSRRFKDLGGMGGVINDLKKQVLIPLYHPRVPCRIGITPMTGILLHGPSGCGKTSLARVIANETGFQLHEVKATQLVSGVSGASEENIRGLFAKARKTAPSIVFIDEIDAIASKRDNDHQKEMERRIVTELMTCMDQPHSVAILDDTSKNLETPDDIPRYVLVIGTTNRPDALDPALRRPGRFDYEIALGVPDENARFQILKVLTHDMRLEGGDTDLKKIARATPGFVGADLTQLVTKAWILVMERVENGRHLEHSKESEENEDCWKNSWTDEDLDKLIVTMLDFEMAVKLVQVSCRREGLSPIPDVTWEDVGGLDTLRRKFDEHIVSRIKYSHVYEKYGDNMETGFLLYGPPGCGKTLIAKAVANESGANFIHIKGPEIMRKYVGDSELAVRTIFSRAKTCSPCIVFFDEVDALSTNCGNEEGRVVERLMKQLLVELDGNDQRKGVYVIGATNRPEAMDPALLRPGRFGKHLYVPLPNGDERGLILKAIAKKMPLDADVDLMAIVRDEACPKFSGADLKALMHEAVMAAAKEEVDKIKAGKATDEAESSLGGLRHTIKAIHFEQAVGKISPSVSDEQIKHYDRVSKTFKSL